MISQVVGGIFLFHLWRLVGEALRCSHVKENCNHKGAFCCLVSALLVGEMLADFVACRKMFFFCLYYGFIYIVSENSITSS